MKSTTVITMQITVIGSLSEKDVQEASEHLAECVKCAVLADDVRIADTKIFTHEGDDGND